MEWREKEKYSECTYNMIDRYANIRTDWERKREERVSREDIML